MENVVLDLSRQSRRRRERGRQWSGWFLGTPFRGQEVWAPAPCPKRFTERTLTLDREYDEKPNGVDKDLFCLISPVSFSCGNLVPAAF